MSFDAYHVDDATDAAIQKEIDAIFETCWSINHLTYIAAERVRMCGALVNQFGNLTSYEDDAALLREARAAIGEDAK